MKYLKNFILKTNRKTKNEFISNFEASIELIPISVAISDLNGTIQYANKTCCLLTEYLKEEIIGKSLDIFKSEYNNETFYEKISDCIKNGKDWSGVFRIKKKSGELFWGNTTITPFFEKSKITHYIITNEDITLIIEQEKKIRNLNELLTYNNNLSALGEAVGGISHDFNNILNGIINLADLLKMTKSNLSEDNIKYINLILQSAEKATELTQKINTVKKSIQIKYTVLDISSLVRNYVNNLSKTIDNKYKIDFKASTQAYKIKGNRAQINNSLDHLIKNAINSMENGGVIKISLDKAMLNNHDNHIIPYSPGEYYSITINDSGCGIHNDKISKIFDPFYSSDLQRSGLGLSTVFNCVKEHKGTIFLDSQENIGSKFSICFPSDTISKNSNTDTRDIIVLFVDDEEINRETGSDLLEYLGYKVLIASNGTEALDIYKNKYNSIDIVLLDMVMPYMNGFETYIAMKKINTNCKAIIATGYSEFINGQELLDNGISTILNKPYNLEELKQVITDNI